MIDRISDVRIRETQLEETTEAKGEQPQDNIGSDIEPMVQATPEYKSGLIAERRMGSQAQEKLLRNQLEESMKAAAAQDGVREPVSFTRDSSPSPVRKTVPEVVKDTLQHVPEELGKQLGEIKKAWSDRIKW